MDGNNVVNIPVSKRIARQYFEHAYEHGEFAVSPPNVPAVVWREIAREMQRYYGVDVETRVDRDTGRSMSRINHGLPKPLRRFTEEAHQWGLDHPGWVAEQNLWCHTIPTYG